MLGVHALKALQLFPKYTAVRWRKSPTTLVLLMIMSVEENFDFEFRNPIFEFSASYQHFG
jgi:hypothetical protein